MSIPIMRLSTARYVPTYIEVSLYSGGQKVIFTNKVFLSFLATTVVGNHEIEHPNQSK